jgi:hypothetical protein
MSEITQKTRPSRRLTWSIGLLALIMSLLTVLQVHRYGATRPTVADPAQGRTHAVKIHERVVYLTTGEFGAAVTSHVMAIGAIGVFLGLLLKSRAAKRNPGTSS